jgi:hypothetical protein
MAEIIGPLRYKGSMGGISVYWNKVLKKWIARQKGGANKNAIENSPSFRMTRENNHEFTACNEYAHMIRLSLLEIDHLNYGYYMGDAVKQIKRIQLLDNDGDRGFRSIVTSKQKSILTDINFNEEHPFNQVLLHRPEVVSDDERQSVVVNIPQFYPRRELNWKKSFSVYRISLTIAQVPDYCWIEKNRVYEKSHTGLTKRSVTVYGDWKGPGTETGDFSIAASFADDAIPPADATVLVAVGIEFATSYSKNTISWTKGDGTMALIACL